METKRKFQKQVVSSETFLEILEMGKITPNFWCSKEYLDLLDIDIVIDNNIIECYDDDILIFPPININTFEIDLSNNPRRIWSDFDKKDIQGYKREFLDFEYFYNPSRFQNMAGGGWACFRKNSRKWPRENKFIYRPLNENDELLLTDLLINWLSFNKNRINIQDEEAILKCCFEGENRKGVFLLPEELVAINVWDENYQFINFRFNFSDPKQPFLNEFSRLLFYLDEEIIGKGKIVNDGGIIDNEGLKFYKDKMNPLYVRKIYSWRR